MSMVLWIISGALGSTILIATVFFALNFVSIEHDARVYLAGYMGIGGILVGAFLLFYAIFGEWRPSRIARKKKR